jgi:3-phenylpropionate/trans-cinnamate dioxygenase ferredoxin reductase subunit
MTHVIVGAGLAGAKAAQTLREEGYQGPVLLLGAEPHRPYERPPLSKEYLQGASEREKVFVHPAAWYRDHDVELRTGTTVTAIDRAAAEVVLDDGARVGYEALLLATGSSPRRLAVPGGDLDGVHHLRTVDDCERLREALERAGRVAIVGAGWIGLEVAAAARLAGAEVTVLEAADRPLSAALDPQIGAVFTDLHREHGVDLRFDVQVSEVVAADGAVRGVRLGDGTLVDAGVVLVGIGATPDTALAEDAGLQVEDGVVVDEHLRTDDPRIFAAGDVASIPHPAVGRRLRVEHWATALHSGPAAARSMLAPESTATAYDRLPYFFTDQYDLGMEYTGHAAPGDADLVVRGDLAGRAFVAFWLREGRLLAGMNVNVWDVTDDISRLIRDRTPVDPRRLADPTVPLTEM